MRRQGGYEDAGNNIQVATDPTINNTDEDEDEDEETRRSYKKVPLISDGTLILI